MKIKKSSHDTCSVCYLFDGKLSCLRRREKHATMIVLREEQVALGVPAAHIDGAEIDRIEEERGGLYKHVCHSIYEGVPDGDNDEFDVDDSIERISDEMDVLIIEMSEHVKE